jgi:uncharacterized iron-regulated membrane protein
MLKAREFLFWCHLVAGIVAGVIVFVMSATGVLLTYEKQMESWADERAAKIEPAPGATKLGPEALVAAVRAAAPDREPASLTMRSSATAPATVVYPDRRSVQVDPYTGAVVREAEGASSFFRVVTDWHRWLGASGEGRQVGRAITGVCNLLFLFIVVSGPFIWLPRKWNRVQFRNVGWFRRGLSGKARDFNWHNVIGVWLAIPLVVVVLSGVVISYAWAGNLAYRIVGEEPPAPRGAPGGLGGQGRPGGPGGESAEVEPASVEGLDRLYARAERQVEEWRTISVQLPKAEDEKVTFSIDSGSGGEPQKRAQLTLARASGEVDKWETFADASAGRRLRTILRFAHTGEVAGIAGQTIAGLASLGACVLVWTGLALSWRRFRAWRARRAE